MRARSDSLLRLPSFHLRFQYVHVVTHLRVRGDRVRSIVHTGVRSFIAERRTNVVVLVEMKERIEEGRKKEASIGEIVE